MPYIANRGNQKSPLWIVVDRPYDSDIKAGVLFSGGMGFVYEKMFREAGMDMNNFYIASRRPNTDNIGAVSIIEKEIEFYKPPLILVVNEVGNFFLPELRTKKDPEAYRGQLQKNAGSLLQSSMLSYPHYMMPVYGPDRCVADWAERNITTYIDFQKMRDELAYFKKHNTLQPLPQRTLKYQDMELDELLSYIDDFMNYPIIADDIENPIYRTKDYAPHPGYPLLLGLAKSSTFGISFKLFRDKPSENRELWRRLDKLFCTVKLLGQNIFNYDALFHEALGFGIDVNRMADTLIRHHILWPELSHKLQFMTRQYTREPYYKDESQSWGIKAMDRYRRYNALDACITMEVYQGQDEEFKQRGHLA
jgi:hypothetical protein